MSRTFWRLYLTAVLLVALAPLAPALGPSIEIRVAPIRANQSVSAVYRDARRLCWTSSADKLRMVASDNTDVFLDHADGDVSYPEVYDEATGRPWHRNGALPIGEQIIRRYCIHLTPDIQPKEPLVLRQVIQYRGWMDLWTVRVPLPPVVSTPPP